MTDYQFYKGIGVCAKCGKNPPKPNRAKCFDCLEKEAQNRRNRLLNETEDERKQRLERMRLYNQRSRRKAKEDGKCINCKKPLSVNSECFCIDCRVKNQRKNDRKKDGIDRSERKQYGRCYICNKVADKGRLCLDCYERACNNLPKKMNVALYQHHKNQNRAVFAGTKSGNTVSKGV